MAQDINKVSLPTKLKKAQENNRLAHAHIFSGASDFDGRTVAKQLLMNFLCETQAACGDCGACVRLQKESSEAFCVLRPDGKSLKVEQVRGIKDFLSFEKTSIARGVLIESADSMNLMAANALLKILEEPPEATYFFLVVRSLASLPLTIRSRCQITSFAMTGRPMDIEDADYLAAKELLKKIRQNLNEGLSWLRKSSPDRETALAYLAVWQQEAHAHLQNFSEIEGPLWLVMAEEFLALERNLNSNIEPMLACENSFFRIFGGTHDWSH